MGRKLTAIQAALESGLGEKTIRLWLKSGKLPATKEGHEWAIDSEVLEAICGAKHTEQHNLINLVEQLRQRIETLEVRLRILESKTPTYNYRPTHPSPVITSVIEPITNRHTESGLLSKGACVRLAGRHGVRENTSDKWAWPEEARKSKETALIFARSKMGAGTRQNWHRCDDDECPCNMIS